jgi:DNA-binding transcriptional ArsR family regulator
MDAFAAIADPTRRRILDLLSRGELEAGLISAEFSVSRPAISRHLRVLREADLVDVRIDAQRRVYRLRAEPFAQIDDWLSRYRRFWTDRLDALDVELRRDAREGA